jgi:signal transduction histidine kinase
LTGLRKGAFSHLAMLAAQRRDGAGFLVSMHCMVMTLEGSEVVYATFRDITNRVRLEQEAREIQAKLIQTNKMTSLGLLVSGVAHEINNPNNFILANSQLLASSWDDARKILREYAAENGEFFLGGVPFSELDAHSPQLFAGILDGARRINEIVHNLKSFARQDQAAADSRFELNQVVAGAITILHQELVRHTERFQVDLGEDLPSVRGRGQQVGQIVKNLLMNACQALPARSHGIWLGTSWDRTAGQVEEAVRDEGCGKSIEERRRIMEPFFTTKLDSGGTGLGLSICQSIVREHQGTLEFTSEPGRGSTFLVRLPAVDPGKESAP